MHAFIFTAIQTGKIFLPMKTDPAVHLTWIFFMFFLLLQANYQMTFYQLKRNESNKRTSKRTLSLICD